MIYLSLSTRDPIVARDGRPFGVGQGRHMRSLEWPYPSVLAGSLRTLVGKLMESEFDSATVAKLKALEIGGPFPFAGNRLFFPAPRDVMFRRDETKPDDTGRLLQPFLRRPVELRDGEGCNLPHGLLPLRLSEVPQEDFKPAAGPAFWSVERMVQWLSDSDGKGFEPPPDLEGIDSERRVSELLAKGFLAPPPTEQRTHMQLQPDTLAAEEGMLFSTTGLALHCQVEMAARVTGLSEVVAVINALSSYHPFGGERRLVHWRWANDMVSQWTCPDSLKHALAGARGVRMVMATPALFVGGWKPAWIGPDMQGQVPGTQVSVRLKAAASDRWKPISGWNLDRNTVVGPKPVRRLVPAGAAYFFVVEHGDPEELADKLWLQSVCDDLQDRRDGFGLALWGVWDAKVKKGGH